MESEDRLLTLLHLRKTFSEYCRMPLSGSKDGDRKFDRVLPLFGKVKGNLKSKSSNFYICLFYYQLKAV